MMEMENNSFHKKKTGNLKGRKKWTLVGHGQGTQQFLQIRILQIHRSCFAVVVVTLVPFVGLSLRLSTDLQKEAANLRQSA